MKSFLRGIDSINDRVGRLAAWLLVPLALVVTYDVAMRYIFNRPTIWAWDINVQLLAALSVLGGGYALLNNAHIGVDVVVSRLTERGRAVMDLVTSLFFFFGVGVFLWRGYLNTAASVQSRENWSSFFSPPIYPLKVVVIIGVVLLLLQGIAKFIRDFQKATAPRAAEPKR